MGSDGSRGRRVLDAIERAGNRLPDPVLIFLWLIDAVIVLSMIGAAAGWQAVNPASQQTIGTSSSRSWPTRLRTRPSW